MEPTDEDWRSSSSDERSTTEEDDVVEEPKVSPVDQALDSRLPRSRKITNVKPLSDSSAVPQTASSIRFSCEAEREADDAAFWRPQLTA